MALGSREMLHSGCARCRALLRWLLQQASLLYGGQWDGAGEKGEQMLGLIALLFLRMQMGHKAQTEAEVAAWLSGHPLHRKTAVGTDGNLPVGIK